MKILAIEHETPRRTAENYSQLLEDEARRVWELHMAGTIRELYFRQERSEAILVLECATQAEAEETLDRLPLVAAGIIRFELVALRAYPGFERLFKGKKSFTADERG